MRIISGVLYLSFLLGMSTISDEDAEQEEQVHVQYPGDDTHGHLPSCAARAHAQVQPHLHLTSICDAKYSVF